MPALRFDHIDMAVDDLEASISFFRKLGFEEVRRTEHNSRAVELKLPGDTVVFELHQTTMTENPGINHIAFTVDDSHAVIDELKGQGITFDTERRLTKSTGRYTSNFRDPGGFRLQLAE